MRFLSDLRKLVILALLATLLILSGCVSSRASEAALEQLVQEGIIAHFDPELDPGANHEIIQVTTGDLVQNWIVAVSMAFPRTYHMHFEAEITVGGDTTMTTQAWLYGYFSGTQWRANDRVQEGDFIAELSFSEPEALLIDRLALTNEIEQFELAFENEQTRRQDEIAQLRTNRNRASQGERQHISLLLDRAELEYRQFIYRTEVNRLRLEERLYNLNAPTRTERLYAPVSGTVTTVTQHTQPGLFRNVPLSMEGANIVGIRVVTIVDESYIHFTASPMNLFTLRYGDIVPVRVSGQDLYFHALVATDPMVLNIRREGGHQVRLIPVCDDEYASFLAELEYLGVNMASAHLQAHPVVPLATDAVLLERRAVFEEGLRNFVMLYENGNIGKRYVELGPTFGLTVQILSGLNPGQQVVIP